MQQNNNNNNNNSDSNSNFSNVTITPTKTATISKTIYNCTGSYPLPFSNFPLRTGSVVTIGDCTRPVI